MASQHEHRPRSESISLLSSDASGGEGENIASVLRTTEPSTLLNLLSIALAKDIPAPSNDSALATTTAPPPSNTTTRRTTRRSATPPATHAHVCALTHTPLKPNEMVLLITRPRSTGPQDGPSSGQVIPMQLAAAATALAPVLRAVGGADAVAAISRLSGLDDLPPRLGNLAQTVLHAAAAAATGPCAADGDTDMPDGEPEAGDSQDGGSNPSRRRYSTGGGTSNASNSAGGANGSTAAVGGDASVRLDETNSPPGRKTKRARSERPPLPPGGVRVQAAAAPPARPPAGDSDGCSGGGDGGSNVGGDGGNDASDLDRERAAIMERNRQKLLELQLPGLVAGLSAAAGAGGAKRQASQRGVGAKRSRESSQEAPPNRRVSLRQRGVAADTALSAGIDHETLKGIQLVAGRQAVAAATGRQDQGDEKGEGHRHPQGVLPFLSDNGKPESDAAFLTALRKELGLLAVGSEGREEEGRGANAGSVSVGSPGAVPAQRIAGTATGGPDRGDNSATALAGLSLTEHDVAKVTKDGITNLVWLPGSDRLLLAACDKGGRVALWDVDGQEDGPAAETDGVLMFSPHSQYVSGMCWLGREAAVGACRLITASYDGSLRALDLGSGGGGRWLQLPAPGDPRDAEFSALNVSSDGRTAYLGDPEGRLDVVDLRCKAPVATVAAANGGSSPTAAVAAAVASGPLTGDVEAVVGPVGGMELCSRKINSLHLEPGEERLIATSCSDGTVAVWDVRKLYGSSAAAAMTTSSGGGGGHGSTKAPKPLSVLHHGKSCHAAYWAGDGSRRLLSTSYDDTLRVWSPSSPANDDNSAFSQLLSISHNNQTGRWITPFKAVWSAACDAVLVGNMKRGLDVYGIKYGTGTKASMSDSATAQLLKTLTSEEFMTAIPSRAACHPALPVVVAATSSGRCHVWR